MQKRRNIQAQRNETKRNERREDRKENKKKEGHALLMEVWKVLKPQ
mgnify:CR=1 FL=1